MDTEFGIDPPEESSPPEALADAMEELEALPVDSEIGTEPGLTDPVPSLVHSSRKGISLFKIGFRQCRYVISETSSPTIFCGAPTEGGSWCQEHRARVFVASSVKSPARIDPRKLSAW